MEENQTYNFTDIRTSQSEEQLRIALKELLLKIPMGTKLGLSNISKKPNRSKAIVKILKWFINQDYFVENGFFLLFRDESFDTIMKLQY